MKAAIITTHTVPNYGAVLQTYATQEIIRKYGYETEVIDYWRHSNKPNIMFKSGLRNSKFWNRNVFSRIGYYVLAYPVYRIRRSFRDIFVKEKVNLTPRKYFSETEIEADIPEADVYITGSDQVWNSECNDGICTPFFLKFVPAGGKRISLASSFGKACLDDWEKEQTKELLKKYDYISVRESSGLDILNDIGINNAVHLMDPTLIAGAETWCRFASKPKCRKYLLIYQLNANDQMDQYAAAVAKKLDLDFIRIGMTPSDFRKSGRVVLFPSVQKFVSLFKYADYVVTDSFHGTAFSIMFEKQISVFMPPLFRTRLESILAMTGLKERVVSEGNRSLESAVIDYKPVRQILSLERLKAEEYLNTALRKGRSGYAS
jgi:Polysaccharide pyruvyl transferase.